MSPPPRLTLRVPSLDATHAVAAGLAALCRPGDVILLAGEMGAGKTAFAPGFGLALGVPAEFDGIVLVEWGDVVESTFGEHLVVRLDLVDGDAASRDITIAPTGPTWARRWALLEKVTQELDLP
jgi:tRNA threonylcarbamoyladenosine biosynthesis protein TsaE